MQPDGSFAEFVSVRWSVLYRLAVLLAGPDEADDLLEGALAGALGSWDSLRDAGSAEEHVRERLAHDAAALPLGAGGRAGPDGPSLRVDALPPRQRVVLVLQCYELLDTGDIARALGCRPDVVEAESAAAYHRLGASAAELTGELERAAHGVPVPLPPIDAILARAREAHRQRARRGLRWAAAVVAALLAGSAVATFVEQRDDGRSSDATTRRVRIPAELDDLPKGREPRTAYVDQNTLHFGVDLAEPNDVPEVRSIVLSDPPTAVARGSGQWYVSLASGEVVLVETGPLGVTTLTESAVGRVVTDSLGRYVAWVEGPQDRPRVVVQATDDRNAAALNRVRRFPVCCADQLEIDGLTPSGELVASVASELRAWVWHAPGTFSVTAGPPVEIAGIGNGVVGQVTAGEVVVQYPPSHFAVGRLDRGSFLAEEDIVASNADFTDPRGERIVYADGDGEIRVGRRKIGFGRDRERDLRLGLPRLAAGYADLVWEDERHVLLDVTDDSLPEGALVRCAVATGACELAVRFGGRHLLAH